MTSIGYGSAVFSTAIVVCACLSASCSSPDTTVFIQSQATHLRQINVGAESQHFSGADGAVGALDTNGLTMLFLVQNRHYVSEKCHETVLVIPSGFYSKSEAELNAQEPMALQISIGVLAAKPGAIDFHDIDLSYAGQTYHPTLIEREAVDPTLRVAHVPVTEVVALNASAILQWYDVTFDLKDFDNRNRFSLSMKGVSVDGTHQDIQTVDFAPVKERHTADHGEAGCMGYDRSSEYPASDPRRKLTH